MAIRIRSRHGDRTVALATLSTASMPAENPTSVSVARCTAQSQLEFRKIRKSSEVSRTAPTW